jgi:hypothetical protein
MIDYGTMIQHRLHLVLTSSGIRFPAVFRKQSCIKLVFFIDLDSWMLGEDSSRTQTVGVNPRHNTISRNLDDYRKLCQSGRAHALDVPSFDPDRVDRSECTTRPVHLSRIRTSEFRIFLHVSVTSSTEKIKGFVPDNVNRVPRMFKSCVRNFGPTKDVAPVSLTSHQKSVSDNV